MALREDIENELGQALADEIDWQVLSDVFIKSGWTKVSLDRLEDRFQAIDIESWIDNNCTGEYMNRGKEFVFEKSQDAEWFSLKWL